MNDTYGYDPENSKIKYHGFDPNSADPGGGAYTPAHTFINPETMVADPNYQPAPGTTDRLGQTGAPTGGKGPSGGGGGPGGFGGSGSAPAPATGATAAGGTTAGTTAASEATPVVGETVSAANQGVTTTPWWQKLLGVGADSSGGSGSTATTALKWLQFAANVYQSQKKGTFQQPPMSPEQKQMFDWAMNQLQSMPSTVGTVKPLLEYDIAHPATIDMQKIRDGKVGYTPNGHMPGADVAAMLRSQIATGGTGPGTGPIITPPAGGDMTKPTDITGDIYSRQLP